MPGSLYNGKRISVLLDGSSRLPGWLRRRIMANEARIQLPLNWYEDDDLLEFSLFSFYYVGGLKGHEDPRPCSLKYGLSFLGVEFGIVNDLFLDYCCGSCNNNCGGSSYQV